MRKFFGFLVFLMMVLLPVLAFSGPFVACTPQVADGYLYILDSGEWVDVTYETMIAEMDGEEYAVILDTEPLAPGPHEMQVKAYVDDPTWGRLETSAVPFSFVKPVGTDPTYGVYPPAGILIIR